ncbi:VOC family protein [Hymenobacter chitinivorans]|uniref:PhnB protein n=1 Tax=Hymenobacter chitinivorans DSM 11115 TaxID=1121954 RepID=A0A2M9B912_9BACT|nr:VOC family protein [Hymenobacter chitinivorans]PJJ54445.1 PhnB protein [Hymenobacter chitinivorans DSM 11115]
MLTSALTPYLAFNGTCREAMTFYQQRLGGDLQMQTYAGTPAAENLPAEAQNNVLHAILTNGSLVLMASDAGQQAVTKGNMVSLSVNCRSEEEITSLFQQFAEGGTITMDLQDTFWGAKFGILTDRFGIDWMFNYDKPTAE